MMPEADTIKPVANDAKASVFESLDRPLVLIGLMGAGKSTVGRRLAKQVERQFIDSDEEIEQAAACSISDIFAIHGEEIFRDLEQRVIFRLLDQNDLILATGGGAWMQPHIRERIKEKALSVWLRADINLLEQICCQFQLGRSEKVCIMILG